MDKKVILVGGFHEIIELCEENKVQITGIIDPHLTEQTYWGCPVLGKDEDAERLYDFYKEVPVLITPDLPRIRFKLYNYYTQIGFKVASLISKDAYVSRSAKIGEGTIVQRGVHISSNVNVGKMVKLNTNANVMHDCQVKDYATVAPDAILLGKVIVNEASYIGANATLLPEIVIGENVIVGAGAVVTKRVQPNTIVKGIPAK